MAFNFSEFVMENYRVKTQKSTLREIYNYNEKTGHGVSNSITRSQGVYALYLFGRLMKIGKATDGIFKRVSQYYRGNLNDGGIKEITSINRDRITIEFFLMNSADDIWAAERYISSQAYYAGENMKWEQKK